MNKNLKKYFFISMTSCFFFLALIMGITVVEKNTSTIISGKNLSLISYTSDSYNKILNIHFLGKDFSLVY